MRTGFIVLISLLAWAALAWGQAEDNARPVQKRMEVERLADLNVARASHVVFYAGDELTVAGGHTSGFVPTATAEYYSGGRWHLMTTVYPHDNGMVAVLDGGRRVLIAGGHEKNLGIGQTFEAEMYYPDQHAFDGFNCLDSKRALFQGVELSDGRVLIVGNHMGNDAFEVFDGKLTFSYLKGVSAWRSVPYILPISGGEVMVFGSVWENANGLNSPCATVDRMKGESFSEPLLERWIPFLFDQNSHARQSFIGDTAAGDYSYIVAAYDDSGSLAFIHIRDTVFSVLPTVCPMPKMSDFGRLRHISGAIADRRLRRVYMVLNDTVDRVYVIAVEYDKRPAPVTIYTSDPLPGFGNATPLLTPEGDLVVTGGASESNFSPLKTVWVLHVADGDEMAAATEGGIGKTWWWIVAGVVALTLTLFLTLRKPKATEPEAETVCEHDPKEAADEGCDAELMSRIQVLMEKERLYLKPDLQITHVADALGVHRNAVSACINSQRGCTFSQLVNDYRLRHVKWLLTESPDMKISAVGFASGFANERSFFRSFKAATGMTPGEWMKREHQGSGESA